MGPNIYFPPPKPSLKLVRASTDGRATIKPAVSATPETPDQPEAHVQPDAGATRFADAALEVAWMKFHRASELLQAEQAHVRDDVLALQAREADIARREEALAAREKAVAERERLILAAMPTAEVPEPDNTVTRFTRAPMDLARSILGGKKSA